MAAITLRQVKGTPLSIVEVDNNFIYLNTAITNLASSPVFTGAVTNIGGVSTTTAITATSNTVNVTGTNIGLYGQASNGLNNYALYLNSGDIYSANAQSWTLNGNLTFSGTGDIIATNFNSLSDESLKENVKEIVNPISVINSLSGVSFTWKESGESAYGFIAQEVEKVLPEIVSTSDEGIKSVKYLQLIAFLLEAIKDQEVRLTKIESKL